jgi:glycosyltransferase involved in cell wall biosynthesis
MNILFINRQDITGGAAIAAYRLAKGLKKHHHCTVKFIVEKKKSNDTNIISCKNNFFTSCLERVINKLTNLIGLQYIWFPFSSKEILKQTKLFKPDVISLHNIHGCFFDTSLLKKLSQIAPIVWTLHDMWSVTSNAAYYDSEEYKSLKSKNSEYKLYPPMKMQWGNILLKRKKSIYQQSNLTIISPSKWLHEISKTAPVFFSKNCKHIFYYLEKPTLISSVEKNKLKDALHIPNNAPILLFNVAEKSDYRKGPDLLLKCLQRLDTLLTSKTYCLCIGNGKLLKSLQLNNISIIDIDYISNEQELFPYYNIADIFVLTSRQDNSPLTLYETVAHELACVCFDIGGCSDIIENNVNGFLIPPFDFEIMSNKIFKLISKPELLNRFKQNTKDIWNNKLNQSLTLDTYFNLITTIKTKNS